MPIALAEVSSAVLTVGQWELYTTVGRGRVCGSCSGEKCGTVGTAGYQGRVPVRFLSCCY